MIKPIETVYNSYRFRSRLEARWAVFFDALGVEYEYEKEGFDLGDSFDNFAKEYPEWNEKLRYYLPDFYLPQGKIWVEIKPQSVDVGASLLRAFYFANQHNFLLISGVPGFGDYLMHYWKKGGKVFGLCQFAAGRKNDNEIWILEVADDENKDEFKFAFCFNPITNDRKIPLINASRISFAYEIARQARFEHGETPEPMICYVISPFEDKEDRK